MDDVEVEVVYAESDRAWMRMVRVAPESTVREALTASGILDAVPAIDLARNRVGVHGTLVKLEDHVAAGDRVEIYRPLIADPKESRRRRATMLKAKR